MAHGSDKHHWAIASMLAILGCTGTVSSIKAPVIPRQASPAPRGSQPGILPASQAAFPTATPPPVISASQATPLIGNSPTPVASPAVTTATSTRSLINARLGVIARLSFEQGRATTINLGPGQPKNSLVSNNAGSAIDTTGGSLISNNSGGLISNNSGGLISNNSGGLISNNSGGLISNNSGAYRLAALDSIISVTAAADEVLLSRRLWDTGEQTLRFQKSNPGALTEQRVVEINADGSRMTQFLYKVVSRHPDGQYKDVQIEHLEYDNQGTLRIQGNRTESVSAAGAIERVVFGPEPVRLRFPEKGVDLDIIRLELDLTTQTGRFAYAFNQTGLREDGEMTQVQADSTGAVSYTYGDPLGVYAGTSTVKNGNGDILFKKTREVASGVITRGYDLGDGITMRLSRGEQNIFRGPLLENGTEVAKVGMVILGDGTTIFDVKYLDDPAVTRRIGYGVMDGSNFPATKPVEPKTWLITTLAGGEDGMADGNATQARFSKLRYLAPSRQQADRFYACESGNSRIIQVDRKGTDWSFKTIAGTGQTGDANGPGPQTTLREPTGIAVGDDDTLYISEISAHRVRKLKQDATGIWQSSVLAGSGIAAFADGSGTAASFYGPAGLALIGTELYVADQGNARIRRIDLLQNAGIVSTIAGQNTRAERDGTGDSAQFKQPLSLAVEDAHTLLIGDRLTQSLRRLDTNTRTVTTLISAKDTNRTPFDGPLDETGLLNPWGILTHQNRILVGYTNLRVIKDGQIKTIAGHADPGTLDGDAQTARFTSIFGMAPLSDGSLLVADGNRFRLLTPPRP